MYIFCPTCQIHGRIFSIRPNHHSWHFCFRPRLVANVGVVHTHLESQEGPDKCFGLSQSPIELFKKTAKRTKYLPIVYKNYEVPQQARIQNVGTTVQILFNGKSAPTISGGILEDEYVLHNIHFHWNSEHTLNDRRYPMESHFVHYLKKAGSFENSLNLPNGIVAFAVFYEYTPNDSKIFNNINNHVASISTKIEQPVPINFVPKELLPQRTNQYYTYQGSLTTPDYNEVVQWIVFPRTSLISMKQFAALTNIYNEKNKPVITNARAMQALNGRTIKYVKESYYCR